MSSEIRANLITSRAGLSTVTMTDSGPMFSGITTFVDNSGFTFGVGGGTSIFTPATNVLTFGTNNTEKIRIDASGHMHGVGVITATHFYGDGSNLTGISAGLTTDAQGNTVGGANAGANFDGTNAQSNTLIGNNAGNDITTGDYNTCVGALAGDQITVNGYHTYIGYNAGGSDQGSGFGRNTAIGSNAGAYIRSSYGAETNVAVGAQCFSGNSGSANVYMGYYAGGSMGGPESSNVAIGYQAMQDTASSANNNVAIGRETMEVVERPNNVAIGYKAGETLGHGENNIIIGANSAASSTTADNEITLGDANITKFRIPGIDFILKDNGGTPTQGHVLTVDGSGEAGFAAPAGPTINNNANTRVITASGNANEFDAQASLFFTSGGDPKLTISGTGHAQLNLTSTGGTDHTGINFGDNDDINAGMIQYSNTGNAMQFHTNGSEKLRVTSDGKIGINVTDPDSDVEINRGSEGKYLTMGGDDANNGRGLSFTSSEGGTGSNGALHTINAKSGNGEIAFATSGSERVRIKNSGHIIDRRGGNGNVFEYYRVNTSLFVVDNLSNESNTRMRIRNPGGQINYNSSSDYRLKENDVKITDGITRIKKLRPIQFKWKSGTNTYDGFFAHEVSEACPQAVDGTKDQVATEDDVTKGQANSVGDPIYQGIDHSKMVPLLTAALQEAITKIETLEQENMTLRVRVTNLEDK